MVVVGQGIPSITPAKVDEAVLQMEGKTRGIVPMLSLGVKAADPKGRLSAVGNNPN